MAEEKLSGGFVTDVVRVGDTVRRTPSPNAAFAHRLLTHVERHGWAGAPRLLGLDDRGREVLSYVDGHVAWPPHAHSTESLVAVPARCASSGAAHAVRLRGLGVVESIQNQYRWTAGHRSLLEG